MTTDIKFGHCGDDALDGVEPKAIHDAERDEKIGREIVVIAGGRRGDALRAMLLAAQLKVRPATPPPPVPEEPAVTQMRKVRFTRRQPVKPMVALDELPPAQRWRIDGTPFFGDRQRARLERQAARAAAKKAKREPPVIVAPPPVQATDLIPCPRCNQYNRAGNYACTVCGFEFGFSS